MLRLRYHSAQREPSPTRPTVLFWNELPLRLERIVRYDRADQQDQRIQVDQPEVTNRRRCRRGSASAGRSRRRSWARGRLSIAPNTLRCGFRTMPAQ